MCIVHVSPNAGITIKYALDKVQHNKFRKYCALKVHSTFSVSVPVTRDKVYFQVHFLVVAELLKLISNARNRQ